MFTVHTKNGGLHQTFTYTHFLLLHPTQRYWAPALHLALIRELGHKTMRHSLVELTSCCGSWITFQDIYMQALCCVVRYGPAL